MVDLSHRFDEMQNHLGDGPLGMPEEDPSDCIIEVGRSSPGVVISPQWGPGTVEDGESDLSSSMHLCFLTVQTRRSDLQVLAAVICLL